MSSLTKLGHGIMSRYLASMEYPEYRKLWLATLCSQSASWALIVARAALVFNMTGSATWTGAVTFAAMIPSVLVSPVAGYLADRFDRRTVLAYAYLVNVGDNLVLAILVVTGLVEPWHVLILSAITGSGRSTQMPAAQALLANMVPRERLLNAVALYPATFHGPVRGPLPDSGGALGHRPPGLGFLLVRRSLCSWFYHDLDGKNRVSGCDASGEVPGDVLG